MKETSLQTYDAMEPCSNRYLLMRLYKKEGLLHTSWSQ